MGFSMKLAAIRSAFINFFADKEHKHVPSSALVPANDPTLLFTNAGMVQFKEYFLGQEKPPYPSAVTSQKVVRAGGKHNDLDNVGYTARHHTFFEMLGNFSFGDYFKEAAIAYAWEFITEVLSIPREKLWVTVYTTDDEAFDIWHQQIGLPKERIIRLGEADNFWSMGDTGPCGPCTEIFYDHGPEVPGGLPGSPEEDGDRYIEIWNIVFMQYERHANGDMEPLPKPSVDTGMGLERIAAVMQGVHSNYEIDLFQSLISQIADLFPGIEDLQAKSLRVIADHIRACAFLIVDGVLPSNEGRGYVLRRIIRRAVRHGQKLGADKPFFHFCVQPLVAQMGEAYSDLAVASKQVETVLLREETRFLETLEQGLKILLKEMEPISSQEGQQELSGLVAFTLYDTYGFPLDLTNDIAREHGVVVDQIGFEKAMAEQKARSKAHSGFSSDEFYRRIDVETPTEFCGYDDLNKESELLLLLDEQGRSVEQLNAGQAGSLVLSLTPFYAESGGQIGDVGRVSTREGTALFEVTGTRKQGKVFVHEGTVLQGPFSVGQQVSAAVDPNNRSDIKANHSATHLLHAALRQELGIHVQQKGSLVTSERLRFDFSHDAPLTSDQLNTIERLVNQQICANTAVQVESMAMEAALDKGAMALFGEKYEDEVRVLSMGTNNFSIELCGGTHVSRTGEIGCFQIVSEASIASGVRRIEAITGLKSVTELQQSRAVLQEAQSLLKAKSEQLIAKISDLMDQVKQQERALEKLKVSQVSSGANDLTSQAVRIEDRALLVVRVADELDAKQLRTVVDQLKQKLGRSIVVLASVQGPEKIQMVAAVEKTLIPQFKAGDIIGHLARELGGKGGGKPELAMAGGKNVAGLSSALQSLQEQLVKELEAQPA